MVRQLETNKNTLLNELTQLLTDFPGVIPNPHELIAAQEALTAYAIAYSHLTPHAAPPSRLRQNILDKIHALQAQDKKSKLFDINHLPLLTPESNWLDWEATVKHIPTPCDYDNTHLHPIESNDKRDLFVAWVKEYVEEEVHFDLLESFLLLEGSCECHITALNGTKSSVCLYAGDYILLEVGEVHDIQITSKQPVKAILQWLKKAA